MDAIPKKIRNIGISAHIDSGKTTLTERILFYCNKIHLMHEVHGKDGVGATMDSMELERERGITIASASTNVSWQDHSINIIDTPGHVDFTIEVERALRVLDGAIMVLDAVGGVQSQTLTVDRQLRRYNVPFVAFVNKCDRTGANPLHVCEQIAEKLGHNAVMVQLPIGIEQNFEGVVDLVAMKALYFDGPNGETVRIADLPAELVDEAEERHERLIDVASLYSDELAEAFLEGVATPEQIGSAIRTGVLGRRLLPVFIGSAYKNRGVQPLLNALVDYLPDPVDTLYHALDLDNEHETVALSTDDGKPTIALAFKLEDNQYGQLTYLRIYQGLLRKGMEIYNSRAQRTIKIGRLIRMHADAMENITEASAGDIVAIFGIDCASGDTFVQPGLNYSMTSMYIPNPVISLAIKPKNKAADVSMGKALGRFTKEDPTFRSHVDPESNETIIEGMGELHLSVYVERMRREYGAEIDFGMPQVAYRETITKPISFDYTHKKQTGGAGQFGRIAGAIEPLPEGDYEFVDKIRGGAIPTEFIPACDKGFRIAMERGRLIGFPVVGVRVTINDGSSHPVDSSDLAFQMAAIGSFRKAYAAAEPKILEPIMRVTVETPTECQGSVFSSISQRRGIIVSSNEEISFTVIEAEAPLAEMFGYATALRSLTQGKAEFSMEFLRYRRTPRSVGETLLETLSKRKQEKVKNG